MDIREQQLQSEMDSDAQASAERLAELRRGLEENHLELPRSIKFISSAFATVRDSILAAQGSVTRGVGAKYLGWLRKVPAETAAYLALRIAVQEGMSVVNGKSAPFQTLAYEMGSVFELEVRIHEALAVNPLYMQKALARLDQAHAKSLRHRKAVLNAAYRAVMNGELDSKLTRAELVQLGKFGLQGIVDAGIMTGKKQAGAGVHFSLTAPVLAYLSDYGPKDVENIMSYVESAMVCPPDAWTNMHDGGYLSGRRKVVAPLVQMRKSRKEVRARVRAEFTAGKMPVVFKVANYLQSQPFTLHEATIRAVRRCWDAGGATLGLPPKNGPVPPPFPFPEGWDKSTAPEHEIDTFQKWKRSMIVHYDAVRSHRGHVRDLAAFFKLTANKTERFWLPVFLDSRGRWYYRGCPNPQGSDMTKAALHFADKKPLGPRGVYWLHVHIANSFGFDKKRFDKRAEFTAENWNTIRSALEAPEDYPDVWGDDSPWCMYAAAWELNQAFLSGNPEAYCTGIPIHMDATCSGLQHFSALLRDPIGGRYTNLLDSGGEEKADIYMKVAEVLENMIQRDRESTDPVVAAQALWASTFDIPRNLVKRPVMTYVYGATLITTGQHIQQYIESDMPEVVFPEGSGPNMTCLYMAKRLFAAIACTVPAAAACMRWLKEVARQNPKGRRMEWTSPMGFRVQHDYQAWKETRVRVLSCGINRVLVRDYTDDTNQRKMIDAIAPNFVHSLDASHLAFTALLMQADGLNMVGIHDSFGTHPSDVDAMHSKIRAAFVTMYESGDILHNFLAEVGGLGEVPSPSTLDLNEVLNSEFFFS